jgi:hypothetical protein
VRYLRSCDLAEAVGQLLTSIGFISKDHSHGKSSVLIELLIGAVEETLASYGDVGRQGCISQSSPSVVASDVKAFLVGAMIIIAIDDTCLQVVFGV